MTHRSISGYFWKRTFSIEIAQDLGEKEEEQQGEKCPGNGIIIYYLLKQYVCFQNI